MSAADGRSPHPRRGGERAGSSSCGPWPVGRHAPLAAALIVVAAMNVAVGVAGDARACSPWTCRRRGRSSSARRSPRSGSCSPAIAAGRGAGHREHARRLRHGRRGARASRSCCGRSATSATAPLSWLSPIGWVQKPRPTPASAGGRWRSRSSPPPALVGRRSRSRRQPRPRRRAGRAPAGPAGGAAPRWRARSAWRSGCSGAAWRLDVAVLS